MKKSLLVLEEAPLPWQSCFEAPTKDVLTVELTERLLLVCFVKTVVAC